MAMNAERVWRALSRVHATIENELERAVQAASGMPLAWRDALHELAGPDSPLTMSELAERVVLSRTRVSRLVEEMASAGLVNKERNPEDARSALVSASEEGRQRLGKATPAYLAALNSGLKAALSPAEVVQLAEALERIEDHRP